MNSQITRFRLKCRKHFKYSLVTDWINVALYLHKVTKIELSVELGVPFVLRLPELTWQNLTVSKLDCNFILRVLKLVTFPCFKVLFIKEFSFPGYSTLFPSNGELRMDCLNESLSGRPLLEELVIIGCDWNGSVRFFSNPLPKKLTLDVGIGGVLDQLNGSSIHFNLPSLVYLKYSESVPEQYFISNLDSVVQAHFEVGFNDDEFEDLQDRCNTMLDVIFGVSNCEILYLPGLCLEALTSGDLELPVFQNLTRLKLGHGYDVSWNDVLLDFLNNSLCLESLTPVQGYTGRNTDDQLDDDCLLGDHPVRSCVSSCLKVINLTDFTGLSGEMGMVKYFLEKAKALEQMVIHWRKSCLVEEGCREYTLLRSIQLIFGSNFQIMEPVFVFAADQDALLMHSISGGTFSFIETECDSGCFRSVHNYSLGAHVLGDLQFCLKILGVTN